MHFLPWLICHNVVEREVCGCQHDHSISRTTTDVNMTLQIHNFLYNYHYCSNIYVFIRLVREAVIWKFHQYFRFSTEVRGEGGLGLQLQYFDSQNGQKRAKIQPKSTEVQGGGRGPKHFSKKSEVMSKFSYDGFPKSSRENNDKGRNILSEMSKRMLRWITHCEVVLIL